MRHRHCKRQSMISHSFLNYFVSNFCVTKRNEDWYAAIMEQQVSRTHLRHFETRRRAAAIYNRLTSVTATTTLQNGTPRPCCKPSRPPLDDVIRRLYIRARPAVADDPPRSSSSPPTHPATSTLPAAAATPLRLHIRSPVPRRVPHHSLIQPRPTRAICVDLRGAPRTCLDDQPAAAVASCNAPAH